MKRSVIVVTAITAILLTSLVFAGGPMHGKGFRGCMDGSSPIMDQLTEDKQAVLKGILDEHRKETTPLRATMWEKRTLLDVLSSNPNTAPETLTALVREMSQLRAQMEEKREALRAKVAKEVGIDLPMGFGRQGDGFGQGRRDRGHFGHRGEPGMMRGLQNMAPSAPDA